MSPCLLMQRHAHQPERHTAARRRHPSRPGDRRGGRRERPGRHLLRRLGLRAPDLRAARQDQRLLLVVVAAADRRRLQGAARPAAAVRRRRQLPAERLRAGAARTLPAQRRAVRAALRRHPAHAHLQQDRVRRRRHQAADLPVEARRFPGRGPGADQGRGRQEAVRLRAARRRPAGYAVLRRPVLRPADRRQRQGRAPELHRPEGGPGAPVVPRSVDGAQGHAAAQVPVPARRPGLRGQILRARPGRPRRHVVRPGLRHVRRAPPARGSRVAGRAGRSRRTSRSPSRRCRG